MLFYEGLEEHGVELVRGTPRELQDMFVKRRIDAGLLPLGGLLSLDAARYRALDLGIASADHALSVNLYTHQPLERLGIGSHIAVTEHSLSSVKLLQVLLARHWRIESIELVRRDEGHDAVLLIGDEALAMSASHRFEHQYDMGHEWHRFTDLPFLFARWVVDSSVDEGVARRFGEVLESNLESGMERLDEIVRRHPRTYMSAVEMAAYIRNFTYKLGVEELNAMNLFEKYIAELGLDRPRRGKRR